MLEFEDNQESLNLDEIYEREIYERAQNQIGARLGELSLSQVTPEAKDTFEAILIDLTRQVIDLERTIDSLRGESINPVTGLPGRYLYRKEIEAAHARFTRNPESSYTLVMWDVDNLKVVNDRFGHQVGDRYLSAAAQSISTSVRKGDMLFSIGGDEITGILYGSNDDESVQGLLKRVDTMFNNSINEIKVEGEAHGSWDDVYFGISAGYEFPTGDMGIAELEDRADQKMYENKRQTKASQNGAIEINPPMLGLDKRLGRWSIRYEWPKLR